MLNVLLYVELCDKVQCVLVAVFDTVTETVYIRIVIVCNLVTNISLNHYNPLPLSLSHCSCY